MMKLAGHTMGTPEYTLREAMKLFSSLGLSGIEIIIARDGYNCAIPETATNEEVLAVRDMAEEIGISVSGITPYLNHFNDLNESVRQKECACLRRVIDRAELLGTSSYSFRTIVSWSGLSMITVRFPPNISIRSYHCPASRLAAI